MQSSQTPKLMPLAFATTGGKNAIPEASQLPGVINGASYADGFPPATRTAIVAGGKPPAGLDMNGILYEITQSLRWAHGGGRYAFSSTFATDANVTGYPAGAMLMSADLQGSWISLNDENTDDPDAGAGTKWVPGHQYGSTAITGLTNANVTLTPAQAAKGKITLAGTLTGNVQIIFPAWIKEWTIVNSATLGTFSITAKTSSGAGVALVSGYQKVQGNGTDIIQPAESIAPATQSQHAVQLGQVAPILSVTASVALNALIVGLTAPAPMWFRNATLTNGATVLLPITSNLSLTIPSGATLGSVNGVQATFAILALYNGGTPALGIINAAGGVDLSETGLISTTAISAGSNSPSTVYSTAAITNSPYRVVGIVQATEAAAGTWATAPSLVQGMGGQAFAAMNSLGFGQTWQDVTASRAVGTTYYNTTNRPISVSLNGSSNAISGFGIFLINGVQVAKTSDSPAASDNNFVFAIVPPGCSYAITNGAGTYSISKWSELR